MTARLWETVQSLLTETKLGTRRASNAAQRTFGGRKGSASLSGGDGASLSAVDGDNATSFPQCNEATCIRPPANDEREITVLVSKDDKTSPSESSVQNGSGAPLSRENKALPLSLLIGKDSLQQDEKSADSLPSGQDDGETTPQDKETTHPGESMKDREYKLSLDSPDLDAKFWTLS